VAGWARNTWEGTVETVLEGRPEAVERLIAFAREGPESAHVERVDVQEEDPEGLSGFAIR
jgi:acylphosphatase